MSKQTLTALPLNPPHPLLQYVLPTDSPSLSTSPLSLALGPMLWAQHKPDRFDTWSAGIVMLQLALPPLRQPRGLQLFLNEYEKVEYDLDAWRSGCRWLTKRDSLPLDENDGAGGLGLAARHTAGGQ